MKFIQRNKIKIFFRLFLVWTGWLHFHSKIVGATFATKESRNLLFLNLIENNFTFFSVVAYGGSFRQLRSI